MTASRHRLKTRITSVWPRRRAVTNRATRKRVPHGAVLIVAIVALAVASVIFLAILRTAVAERSAVRVEAWRQQADWLAESALERAAARLAADPAYQGETWNLPADQFGTGEAGVVLIAVGPPSEGEVTNRRLVRVRADYPDDPQHRARRSKEAIITVEPSTTGDVP